MSSKRNRQKVVDTRWEKKEKVGRVVKEEYVKPPVQPKNQVQAEFLHELRSKPCAVMMAPAGVGKTFIAASEAVDWLKRGDFDKIILTRPAVGMGNTIGLLKGGLREKYEPYLLPLVDVITGRYGKGFYENALSNGTIEMMALEYVRGRSIKEVVIVDEAQNCTPEEAYTLLTRIEEGGVLIMIGDGTQTDLRGQTGIEWLVDFVDRHPHLDEVIGVVEGDSDDIVRGGLCKAIVQAREKDLGANK
jgi:phosphate starvation-inducible PhoH-like protein